MVSCDRSNESCWAVRSCGTVCCDVQDGSTLFGTVLEILLCDLSNEHSSSVFPYRSTSLSRCTYNMKFWRIFFCISIQFEWNENGLIWLQLLLLCNKKPSSIESTCQPYWAFNIKYITSIQSNCVKNDTQKGYSNSEETLLHADQLLNTWPAPNVSGFIAQLVEHRTGIARSRVQTPLKSWIFFFSCFFTQLHKLRSLRRAFLHFHKIDGRTENPFIHCLQCASVPLGW